MCLITNQKWPKIAWKPITTYKVVYSPNNQSSLLTIFQCFPIQIDKTYKETLRNIFGSRKSFPQVMKCILDYIQLQKKISQEQLQNVIDTMAQ